MIVCSKMKEFFEKQRVIYQDVSPRLKKHKMEDCNAAGNAKSLGPGLLNSSVTKPL